MAEEPQIYWNRPSAAWTAPINAPQPERISAPQPERKRVYLSFSHIDGGEFTSRLIRDLAASGIIAYADREEYGSDRAVALRMEEALTGVSAMIFVGSHASAKSAWCQKEIDFFRKNTRNPIIPISVDDVPSKDGPSGLRDKLWIDFSHSYQGGFAELLNRLEFFDIVPQSRKSRSATGLPVGKRVFINYRREDTAAIAGRLYDRLSSAVAQRSIFMDVDSISPGENYAEKIKGSVKGCDAFLMLMGRQWLDIRDQKGQRRIDSPRDFVRMEIATALQEDIRIIPLLIDGSSMPEEDQVPEEIRPICYRQALELRNSRFDKDFSELIATLS
jgi:hypothetical protein